MTTLTQITLPMPRLGETMEQGTISKWLVQPGDDFKRGDPLLELETDKTLVEYPALGSGKLLETLVGPGDVIDVGISIAVIETDQIWEGIDTRETEGGTAPPTEQTPEPRSPAMPSATANSSNDRLRATPLARRIAGLRGISLDSVMGSGRRGRIEARDVEAHVADLTTAQPVFPMRRRPGAGTPPVLFIHGFAGLGSNFAAMRSGLRSSGVETSAPDMPGHGRNPVEATGTHDLIDWLVSELAGQGEPVHLVGHSLGAHVAAMAAHHMPEKIAHLTLVAPVGCGHDINGEFLRGMAAAQSPGELRHLLRLLGPEASRLADDAILSMADELAKQRLTALANEIVRRDTQCIDTIGVTAGLAERMSVTAVFGIADLIVPKEHVFNMPARVASHMVDTGHMPHWDAPGLLQSIITQTI
jgi:pyruvate dehydrogenase E2 component (dihydrolipoamide acetyltransferase)